VTAANLLNLPRILNGKIHAIDKLHAGKRNKVYGFGKEIKKDD